MKASAVKLILGAGILTFSLFISEPVRAQIAEVTLPEAVPDLSRTVSANAATSTEHLESDQSMELAQQAQSQAPIGNLPNAPSSTQQQPSLGDLGITPEQAQGNIRE